MTKILLSFKFVFVYQISQSFVFFLKRIDDVLNPLDYAFIVLCVIFRYIIIFLGFLYLFLALFYFLISLVFNKKVDLAFSKKYYDESRLSILFFILLIKLPWACAKYTVYSILKFLFSRTRIKTRVGYSFVFNFIFINIFGSPR